MSDQPRLLEIPAVREGELIAFSFLEYDDEIAADSDVKNMVELSFVVSKEWCSEQKPKLGEKWVLTREVAS